MRQSVLCGCGRPLVAKRNLSSASTRSLSKHYVTDYGHSVSSVAMGRHLLLNLTSFKEYRLDVVLYFGVERSTRRSCGAISFRNGLLFQSDTYETGTRFIDFYA